jgi:hypothetical protein
VRWILCAISVFYVALRGSRQVPPLTAAFSPPALPANHLEQSPPALELRIRLDYNSRPAGRRGGGRTLGPAGPLVSAAVCDFEALPVDINRLLGYIKRLSLTATHSYLTIEFEIIRCARRTR